MSLLSRLTGRTEVRDRVEPRLSAETRREVFGDGWAGLGNMASMSGRGAVNPHLAENLSAVLGATELIAGSVASLPSALTVDTLDGPVPAPDSATAWNLLRRPNPRQSWPAFMVMTVSQLLLQGNSLAAVQADGRGAVTGLVPVPWPWLNVVIVHGAGGPRVAYDLVQDTVETQLLGVSRRMLDSDVMHVRARTDTGIIGRSVLTRAAGVVREGLELATVAEATWKNGMRPSGFFTLPQLLKASDFDRLKAMAQQYQGAMATGRVPVMMGGAEFKQLAMSSVDAEFLSTRRFGVAEIARLFCIPEPMLQIGDHAPASLDPYLATFAQLALAPIVSAIEAEFDHAILPAGYHLQLDMGGLLRGNYSSMVAALCAAVQSRIMTPNDARRAVGLPAHADGDALSSGPAPSLPADAKGMPHMGQSPGKTGDGVPAPGTNGDEGAG